MNIEKVKIVADSSSDILSLDNIGFASAPLKIMTSEREFVDNSELDVREMVDYLKGYNGKSSTSCPNIGDWLSAFGDAEYVFCITITASLSGSYNAARLAKEAYESEHPGRRVYVLNSLSTGPEMCLVIEKMKELIVSGLDFDEVCEKTDEYCKNTGLLFMLESMRNLANNGRVSHVAAKMAGILGIRALGKASDRGDLEMLEKCRGEKRTVDAIIEQLKAHGFKCGKIRIAHCFNEKLANTVKERLISEFGDIDMEIYNCRGLCSFYAELGGLLLGFEKN
ncbi:MAG: DegV family protein [Ruminococcaceae bacterium]|nr:DegV family protein [Oscillospiraceae bacterium]